MGVSDGDTITVLLEGKGQRIRLYGIDCPEKHQDFDKKAKQFTSDMAFGKEVEVKPVTVDRYDRTVALVYLKNLCLNEEIVKNGLTWVYRRYCDKPTHIVRHLIPYITAMPNQKSFIGQGTNIITARTARLFFIAVMRQLVQGIGLVRSVGRE